MKKIFFCVSICLLCQSVNAEAEVFIKPTDWDQSSSDHYNTYEEDSKHPCHIRKWLGMRNESKCDDSTGYTAVGYVLRDCGYDGQCSYSDQEWHHAGVDYDDPRHIHDPLDYDENGIRKDTELRQGKGFDTIDKLNKDDDKSKDYIVASGSGKVVYAQENSHGYGNTVIIRHICDSSDSKAQGLCVKEGNDLVIYTQYSHLSEILVKHDDNVFQNDKIGLIGGSGGWIHHLHFEFKTKNTVYSPINDDYKAYTPGNPNEYGYRNPVDFIDKVSVTTQYVYYGPDLPSETDSPFRCVLGDTICWSPPDSSCVDSQLLIYKGFRYYNDGMLGMLFACSKAYNDAVSEGLSESYWRDVFLGHNDISSIGTCRQ